MAWWSTCVLVVLAVNQVAASPADDPYTMSPIDISTEGCGTKKGCYREPKGCNEMTCDYMLTWRDAGDAIDFEMASRSHGWVAVGFSNDIRMGEDSVTECIYDIDSSTVKVFNSYNSDSKKTNFRISPDPMAGLSRMTGYYSEGSIKCAFRRQKAVAVPEMFDLSDDYYIMLARGEALKGDKLRHKCSPHRLPIVSPGKVSLDNTPDINGRSRYPLAKAHGILMIIAWIFFASIGVLLARYYKPMWVNRKVLGDKYWFFFHRCCQFTVLVLTVIAFIIIFVEADGYTQTCDLPARAHPILGIIITCCVIINFIMAYFRCDPEGEFRPVFNWFHWAFGTIAVVLSAVTIFIGMGMSKADVPYWVSWVMVAFVIFHIIVELSLEIHQCCMHKRNKERKEEYELQRKGDPRLGKKEPKYIGRGFKQTMLYIYVPVVAILTFLMVIGIAVG